MKVPLSWLREYVDIDVSPEELAARLTFSGTEVGGVTTVGADYEGLVVGEVLSVGKHPSADRLSVCRVSDGSREYPVVCGAPNVQAGQKTAFAPAGATLPNGMKIKKAKLRGEISEGMLCAEDELGISDDHTGILVFDPAVKTGAPLRDILPPKETIIDVEITWNRPDCLSIIGMAREIAALLGRRIRVPSIDLPETNEPVESVAGVTLSDPEGCPRYTARVLRNVTIGPSPRWMQQRLAWCGVRPISNAVDITNYVMIECGQPLHAFDLERLAENRIVVRRSAPGETMATLDGQERRLPGDTVVIADGKQAVALAGIMGGAGSEIHDSTRNVLLESACFDPARIHRASVAVGLVTESSRRFERGVDIGGADWASRRAAALMVAHAGGAACRGVIDAYPGLRDERRVRCRFAKSRSLLGMPVSDDAMVGLLERLELPVERRDADGCTVRVPTFRRDIEEEADLIEEVARIHGLDKVPDTVPQGRIVPEADDRPTRALAALRARLAGLGLTEVMNYSFTSSALLDAFESNDSAARVCLPNPVSADYAVMRPSLIPQIVDTLGRNLSRQTARAAVFEIGRVYRQDGGGSPMEAERVGIGLMGRVGRVGPDGKQPVRADEMFLWVKGVVEALVASPLVTAEFAPATHPAMEPGAALSVRLKGQDVGVIGLLSSALRHRWRMAEPVAIAELDLVPLRALRDAVPELKKVTVFPSVARDVALFAPKAVSHAQIVEVIRRNAPSELTTVDLFDIYEGESIGADRRSLAYSLVYRSAERTLTDDEANALHESVKSALKRELGVEIREG
jgi:phenylalanyl-tRNA synthetase beta chain